MRSYLSIENLVKALLLGAVVTLLSAPRMHEANLPLDIYIPAAFISMILVAGAATAWSKEGGLAGLIPPTQVMLTWLGWAFVITLVVLPIQYFWSDPIVRAALERTGNERLMEMRFPSTFEGGLALVMWTASFEMLFFQASTMSFMARLTHRLWAALLFAVLMRSAVGAYQIVQCGITEGATLMMILSFINSVLLSLAYARGGLPVAAALSAGLTIHVLF